MDKKAVFNGIEFDEMKDFLDENFRKFNNTGFIENDPISIPHRFKDKRDIELSGFLTATISWGRRDQIIKSATRLMEMMGESPYQFLVDADNSSLERFADFYYRTFQGQDCIWFLKSLKRIYNDYESLEDLLLESISEGKGIKEAIVDFRRVFFETPHQHRSEKHFANPENGAAAKRLNMYFRWMVRNDKRGVDFGIWNKLPTSILLIPLDIHSGNIARKLGLLNRKANDWKAVEELTSNLRLFDANDPVKYDYSLFGLGVNNMI